MKKEIAFYLSLISIIGIIFIVATLLLDKENVPKRGYIINQVAFEKFSGKNEMEEKLNLIMKEDRQERDSLAKVISNTENINTLRLYQEKLDLINKKEKEYLDQFTASIWMQINQYVQEYGKENNYDFIYGATGDGSLMYAAEDKDITDQVVNYINQKYEGK